MFENVTDAISFIETRKRNDRSLDNMFKLCEFFGHPESDLKFIHVAGTNGKGSVVSYLRYILCENESLKVGSFTSPYIECFNERIQINGEYISDDDLLYYADLIADKFDEMKEAGIEEPGFFAFITLISLLYFRDRMVDIAIMEVGIGGLVDCTNVITPLVSIISNVSYDHMNILGDTLQEIATQKLGIVKKNIPLVTIENEEINDLIISTCASKNSKLKLVKRSDINIIKTTLTETTFDYKFYKNVKLRMLGHYQAENASLVIEACDILNDCGFDISEADIYNGLENTFWLGRLEVIQDNPIIIFDGAHNIDGINRLYEYLVELRSQYPTKHLRLALAISANKEKFKMIDKISPIADEIIFTTFNYKRSEDGKVLLDASNAKNKRYMENVDEILDLAIDSNDDYINVFAGSLYFVSELRKKYFARVNKEYL